MAWRSLHLHPPPVLVGHAPPELLQHRHVLPPVVELLLQELLLQELKLIRGVRVVEREDLLVVDLLGDALVPRVRLDGERLVGVSEQPAAVCRLTQ